MKSMADRAGFNPARGHIMKGEAAFLPIYRSGRDKNAGCRILKDIHQISPRPFYDPVNQLFMRAVIKMIKHGQKNQDLRVCPDVRITVIH